MFFRIVEMLLFVMQPIKVIAYTGLAILLYFNFIGPDAVVKILMSEDITKAGMTNIGIMVPKYVLWWTLITVILEGVSNLLGMMQPLSNKL